MIIPPLLGSGFFVETDTRNPRVVNTLLFMEICG